METKNDITELRSILFDTLRGLKDKSIDIDHAKAINDTAQVIVNSAKVEVDYAKNTGTGTTSNFMQVEYKPRVVQKHEGGYMHKIGDRHSS